MRGTGQSFGVRHGPCAAPRGGPAPGPTGAVDGQQGRSGARPGSGHGAPGSAAWGSQRGARGLAASMNRRTARPHGVPSRARPLAPRGISAGLVRKVRAIAPRKVTPGVDFSSLPAGLCPRTDSCLCPCSLHSPWGRWPAGSDSCLFPGKGPRSFQRNAGRVTTPPSQTPAVLSGPSSLCMPPVRALPAQVLKSYTPSPWKRHRGPGLSPSAAEIRSLSPGLAMGTGGSAGCREQPRSPTAERGEAAASFVRHRPGAARLRPRGSPAARLGSARPSRRSAPRTRCTLPGVVRYC